MRMLFVGLLAMLSGAASAQKTSQVTSPRGTQVNDIPILGLGTWQIHTNGANVTEIIASAIQSGYRLLDCAFSYNNQKQIAVGIKEGLRRTGLSRKDLWITSKLWNTKHADAEAGIRETLGELGLEYLDLFLIHWPVNSAGGKPTFDHVETWKRMEKLVRPGGPTRFIGVSNFSPRQIDEVLKIATVIPKVHQIELHPYLQEDDYVNTLQKQNITVQGYAPLANTNPQYRGGAQTHILSHSVITGIAKSRSCTPAQVVLAWNMARGVSVVPKAAKIAHQKENLATVNCKLEAEDLQKIKGIRGTLRLMTSPCQPLRNACFEGLGS